MLYRFIKGNFNNFFLERGLRKTSITVRLIFHAIDTIIDNTNWRLHDEKPIWINTSKEERHFSKLDDALDYLSGLNKFTLFVTLLHKNKHDKAFIRWYSSEPQVDVLSIEGAFSIEEGKLSSLTPIHMLKEIIDTIKQSLENKLSPEDTRELNLKFSENIEDKWLTNKLTRK